MFWEGGETAEVGPWVGVRVYGGVVGVAAGVFEFLGVVVVGVVGVAAGERADDDPHASGDAVGGGFAVAAGAFGC